MGRIAAAALLTFVGTISYSEAFSPSSSTTCPATGATSNTWGHSRYQQQQQQRKSSVRLQSIFYDDFEDFSDFAPNSDSSSNSNNNNNNVEASFSDGDLFASLRARQDSLKEEQQRIKQETKAVKEGDLVEKQRLKYNWDEANCLSTVRLTLDDWIRRLAVDLYPLVVCGSSRGNLYLGDLEEGDEMDCLERVHADSIHPDIPESVAESCIQAMYDGYDGNGPFAVAVKKDLIVSSGREGGIHACSIVGDEVELPSGSRGGKTEQTKLRMQPEGQFRGLTGSVDSDGNRTPPPLITCLAFDDRGHLWAGGYDGVLRGYNHEELDQDDRLLMLRQKRPDFDIDVGSPILDISVEDETGIIVVTTQTSGVFLHSLHDGRFLMQVDPFSTKRRNPGLQSTRQFSRTAMIVRNDNSTTMADEVGRNKPGSEALLIIGGSQGHLYQVPISIVTDDLNPSRTMLATVEGISKIRPKHMGPVVSLASPSPGLFVTASHDGTMRVWDCVLGEDDDEEDEVDDDDEEATEMSSERPTGTKLKMPKVLYALSGYKVWLGSVFANDRKLVSDGADNTVIVHSFDEDEDAILRSQQEDDEDNDLGDGPFSSLS
jgi:WD40 repeat protein